MLLEGGLSLAGAVGGMVLSLAGAVGAWSFRYGCVETWSLC